MSIEEKELAKAEKKRQKALVKMAKKEKDLEPSDDLKENDVPSGEVGTASTEEVPPKEPVVLVVPKGPWYKNPEWVRAIIAMASLVIAMLTLAWMMGVFN